MRSRATWARKRARSARSGTSSAKWYSPVTPRAGRAPGRSLRTSRSSPPAPSVAQPSRRADLPAHPRRAVGRHRVRRGDRDVERRAGLVAALLARDAGEDRALEDLEVLGLLGVQVLGREAALAAVVRLHLEDVLVDAHEAKPVAVGSLELLSGVRH